MKVTGTRSSGTRFASIEEGKVFTWSRDVWMKVRLEGEPTAAPQMNTIYAVNLRTGWLKTFRLDTRVQRRPNATIVLEP